MKSVYLVIAHGSRDPESNEAFQSFLEDFRKAFPGRNVTGAFLELSKPGVPEAIEKCIASGAETVFILPMMLFPGRHVKNDIPKMISEAKAKHPEVDFHYGGPFSDSPKLREILEEKTRA